MTSTFFIKEIPNLVAQLETDGVRGDFAEVGVLAGRTFVHLVRHGKKTGRMAHAFDSFQGMGRPGPHDGDQYPMGRFDMGGVMAFQKHFEAVHLHTPAEYRVWPGFIPECFCNFMDAMPGHKFALAHIDVDHYQPTLDALNFMAPRMSQGGFMVLDDYLPSHPDMLATRAIDEWLTTDPGFDLAYPPQKYLILRKRRDA